jgi:hypothetical protein
LIAKRPLLKNEHPKTLASTIALAVVYKLQNRFDEA